MYSRHALTLVEVLVVLAILAILIALLLPAVQAAREKARETVCKNNLHQLNLSVASFAETQNRLPDSNPPGLVGGWSIEILPYLEQRNLAEHVQIGAAIADAPDMLLQLPSVFRCPVRRQADDMLESRVMPAHYVFAPNDRRESYRLYDAPLKLSKPWASGPEVDPLTIGKKVGPHHGGFFCAAGWQQGVDFVPGGRNDQ